MKATVLRCRRISALLALSAMIVFAAGLAGAAAPGCLDSDPVPNAPSAGSDVVTFTGNPATTEAFNIILWRLPCQPNASRLFVRITPTAGSSFICGSSFVLVQGGNQYNVALAKDLRGLNTFCGDLLLPAVFPLLQYVGDPHFDHELALTLIYKGLYQKTQGDLPAAGDGVPTPTPIIPVAGLWWNPNEPGSGYTLWVRDGFMVVTVYAYGQDGSPQWYLAVGALLNGGHDFTATLDKYRAGQCISCVYAAPRQIGNDGTIAIAFSSPTLAVVSLPGGRTIPIQPF